MSRPIKKHTRKKQLNTTLSHECVNALSWLADNDETGSKSEIVERLVEKEISARGRKINDFINVA